MSSVFGSPAQNLKCFPLILLVINVPVVSIDLVAVADLVGDPNLGALLALIVQNPNQSLNPTTVLNPV
jgi:hypothetical protein